MTSITHERPIKHLAETTGEALIRRQRELARVVLPHTVNEAADADFITAEDALSQLNFEADTMITERGKPTRKVRRGLLRYARRLLELTDQEPDLLDPRSISLLAHASDATGERTLLKTTLEQAQRAEMTSDTDVNLRAIEAALELDKPFSEIMQTLNTNVISFEEEAMQSHIPLEDEYDYLFDNTVERHVNAAPRAGDRAERPLFRD